MLVNKVSKQVKKLESHTTIGKNNLLLSIAESPLGKKKIRLFQLIKKILT